VTAVLVDQRLDDEARRAAVFRGDIVVTAPTARTEAFCAFARELLEEAFAPLDPELAQHHLPVEGFAAILAELKPRFIHHPRSKQFIGEIIHERGGDPDETHFDVPRLRSSTSGGYLTSGIAYAWHPHRDTWYSAPMNQVNYWMPVYPVEADNAMAFHTAYFDKAVPNSSASYNYYEWNAKHRASASTNIGKDTRPLPAPTADVDISDPLVIVPPVGGLIQFSAQHLHSSVPNMTGRTRFSIDFRTIHIDDIVSGRAAPNVDARCTGSSIRDFVRTSDLAELPDVIVDLFADGTENRGDLVYSGASSVTAVAGEGSASTSRS
jgi:hypothetical protein